MSIGYCSFRGLNCSLTYLGIGRIRFYDQNDNIYSFTGFTSQGSGAYSNGSLLVAPSTTFTTYYSYKGVDTTLNGSAGSYWLANSKVNQYLNMEFINRLNRIKKFTFVPVPEYTNRGIQGTFYVDFRDENNNLIITYTISAGTTLNGIQEVLTPELNVAPANAVERIFMI